MTNESATKSTRRNPPALVRDEQVLLRILVAQATQRGDTLAKLARALGVTYERLAQWRRQEADIGRAQRSVHEHAAVYLGVPVVLVLTLAGTVSLKDFVWPEKVPMSKRVQLELERLRQDPFFAAFVPDALSKAEPGVQLLVAFLYRELNPSRVSQASSYHWLAALHQAALGHAEGLQALGTARSGTSGANLFLA
jgi:hypothetical protein